MNGLRKMIVITALLACLAGCATSGLKSAGDLGDSGSKLNSQAAASYALASEQLESNAVMHCASEVLATKRPCEARLSKDVAGLAEVINTREALYGSLGAYYSKFSEAARLPAVSLTEVTNSSVSLAGSLATLMGTEFGQKGQDSLTHAGAQIGAIVQIVEEKQRLKKLRDSSAAMRNVLAVIVASYEVEQGVLESIGKSSQAQRKNLVNALAKNKLLDVAPIISRGTALIGAPVAAYTEKNKAEWDKEAGRALVLFMAGEEARRALAQRTAANKLVASGFRALINAHEQFESDRSVTQEDVDVFTKRLAVILSHNQPKEP